MTPPLWSRAQNLGFFSFWGRQRSFCLGKRLRKGHWVNVSTPLVCVFSGNKELEPLKYSKVAAAASVSRQKAAGCIQGTVSLLSYCLGKGENVAFVLRDIGVLLIEGKTVQMKSYYDFLVMLSGKENLEQVIFKVSDSVSPWRTWAVPWRWPGRTRPGES